MPKPADVVGYLQGSHTMQALGAWSLVIWGAGYVCVKQRNANFPIALVNLKNAMPPICAVLPCAIPNNSMDVWL